MDNEELFKQAPRVNTVLPTIMGIIGVLGAIMGIILFGFIGGWVAVAIGACTILVGYRAWLKSYKSRGKAGIAMGTITVILGIVGMSICVTVSKIIRHKATGEEYVMMKEMSEAIRYGAYGIKGFLEATNSKGEASDELIEEYNKFKSELLH